MVIDWLPSGKDCAICFSIDDVHPAKSTDYYEAGGDLNKGALGHVEWLLKRHDNLKVTLFITANWREISAYPTRKILSNIPYIKNNIYLAKIWSKNRMRLDKHPDFVSYLNNLKRTEIGFHGLYHCHKGINIPIEFQDENYEKISKDIKLMEDIFIISKLRYYKGICPPGWNAPRTLIEVLKHRNFNYIASARDILTPICSKAKANMSGLKNQSLIFPDVIDNSLVHFTTNFQATSHIDRALNILDSGGLLKIKGHITKTALGINSLDGLDQIYSNYLDLIFSIIDKEFGNRLWWTSMGEISDHILKDKK